MNSKNYNYLKSILLTCSMMCLLVNSVIAQVSLSVTVRPPYSAQLNDYRHLGNKAIITLVNSSATALQIKLTGSLTNESSGLFISTNNNYRPSAPITIAPHGSTTITADAGAMNFLDQGNTTTNASDKLKQNIMSTGLLPEGTYRLCIVANDYNTGTALSIPNQGCFSFNITQAQPPVITYPMNGQSIPATQKAVNFSWTPPLGNLAGAVVRYKLVVVDLIPGQNPNDAIAVARDYRANNPTIYKTGLASQIYVTQPTDFPFIAGHSYAVQVVASDANNRLAFMNNGGSGINVFKCDNGGNGGNGGNGNGSGSGDGSDKGGAGAPAVADDTLTVDFFTNTGVEMTEKDIDDAMEKLNKQYEGTGVKFKKGKVKDISNPKMPEYPENDGKDKETEEMRKVKQEAEAAEKKEGDSAHIVVKIVNNFRDKELPEGGSPSSINGIDMGNVILIAQEFRIAGNTGSREEFWHALAHECGHALGLKHAVLKSDEKYPHQEKGEYAPPNLMAPGSTLDCKELTEDQRMEIKKNVRAMIAKKLKELADRKKEKK